MSMNKNLYIDDEDRDSVSDIIEMTRENSIEMDLEVCDGNVDYEDILNGTW